MAIDTTFWENDLAGMVDDLPTVAMWDSVLFNCSTTELDPSYGLTLTGNIDQTLLECTFPASAVSNLDPILPEKRIQLRFPNVLTFASYRITHSKLAADGIAYTLILTADTRN